MKIKYSKNGRNFCVTLTSTRKDERDFLERLGLDDRYYWEYGSKEECLGEIFVELTEIIKKLEKIRSYVASRHAAETAKGESNQHRRISNDRI